MSQSQFQSQSHLTDLAKQLCEFYLTGSKFTDIYTQEQIEALNRLTTERIQDPSPDRQQRLQSSGASPVPSFPSSGEHPKSPYEKHSPCLTSYAQKAVAPYTGRKFCRVLVLQTSTSVHWSSYLRTSSRDNKEYPVGEISCF